MRFIHIADCHIGAWREEKMRMLGVQAFQQAIQKAINEDADFVIIAGDLFHTALPSLDLVKQVVSALKKLKDQDIPMYFVPGSHDYSPSGKTILDVIEEAGLGKNVARGRVEDEKLCLKFTVDNKTGAKLTGILGKRSMLEKAYYENLNREALEAEPGIKIFILHTAIEELKPVELSGVDSCTLSLLPKNFTYYAAGHVHYRLEKDIEGYGKLIYPGPLFPDSIKELEELVHGEIVLVEADEVSLKVEKIPLLMKSVVALSIDANGKTAMEVKQEILDIFEKEDISNCIVILRISGTLDSGKISDINFKHISLISEEQEAYTLLRNTSGLVSKEFEEIKVNPGSAEEIEEQLISEHTGQIRLPGAADKKEEIAMVKRLMQSWNAEKQDGETINDYEKRMKEEAAAILSIEYIGA